MGKKQMLPDDGKHTKDTQISINANYATQYGFNVKEEFVFKAEKGLSETVINQLSQLKKEPEWMHKFRLNAYKTFLTKPMPSWGADLSEINFDDIYYYLKPIQDVERTWDDVPDQMKSTFERLGVPQAEREFLAGVKAQFDSEVIYGSLMEELSDQGVIFMGTDEALQKHPEFFTEYFSKVVPVSDNKFAALNSAVWSGGSFVYVPKGVKVARPLQAYFRINAKNFGQFERTLIIVDEGAEVSYVEGCSAPVYSSDSLHAAVVEVIVKKGARCRYTTIQNWSSNVYNLVTKRARVEEDGVMEWIDGNLGCLTGDTDVLLENGTKKISEVKLGDRVLSINSQLQFTSNKVIAIKTNEPSKVYEMKTLNQRILRATENHPLLVWKKTGKCSQLAWLPLNAIEVGDHVAVSGLIPDKGVSKDIDFENAKLGRPIKHPTKSSPDLLWLLGFYIGDGFVDGTRLCIAVPETDKSFSRVKELVIELFGVAPKLKRNVLQINSSNLVRFFKSLSMQGNAHTKRIPDWVFELPMVEKNAFIEGYIAADGHFRENHRNVSITSASRELLEQVRLLGYMCGLNPTKISKWTRREKKKLGIEEKVYTHYFLFFGNTSFETSCIFSRVVSLEGLEDEITYDIEVENDQNFVANGIFVHNSRITMKYPSCYLVGDRARGELLSVAYAGHGQHQDAGAKMVHIAPNTTSLIVAKSVSANGGRTSYRGLVSVIPAATNAKSRVECDALILDEASSSDTYPVMKIENSDANIEHEATVSKIGEEKIFYLMSRGLTEAQAMSLIVSGFIEPIVKQLPLEYAVELNRLIELEMEGSVG